MGRKLEGKEKGRAQRQGKRNERDKEGGSGGQVKGGLYSHHMI